MAENKDKAVYIHGDLELHIIEARRLSNMDVFSERLRQCFTTCDTCRTPPPTSTDADKAARKGRHNPKIMTSDPYVTVTVPQATVARTRVIKSNQISIWDERFHIPLAYPVVDLEVQVKDGDVFGSELIGTAQFPIHNVLSGKP